MIQRNVVGMVGQHLAETGHADGPVAGTRQRLLHVGTDVQFGNLALPALTAGRTLIAEAAGIGAFLAAQVAEAGDIEARGATAEVILVVKPLDPALGADAEMVVHDVVAQLARGRSKTAVPDIRGRVHHDPGRIEAGGVQEHHVGGVFIGHVGFGIDDLDALGALGILVIDHLPHDREGPHRQVARRHRHRQRRRLGAEIGAIGAAQPAFVAILAVDAVLFRLGLGDVGAARIDQVARAAKGLLQARGHVLFDDVQRDGRQELAVGQLFKPFVLAGNAGKAFHMVVPGRNIGIADRPVGRDAFAGVGGKVDIGQTIGLAPPQERPPAHVIGAEPVEALFLGIGVFLFVGPHAIGLFVQRIVALQDRIVVLHLDRGGAAMGVIPGFLVGVHVIGQMLDIAAAFQHQDLQALLGQFLGGPTAADA